jgi:uncharacterized membrane protein
MTSSGEKSVKCLKYKDLFSGLIVTAIFLWFIITWFIGLFVSFKWLINLFGCV